jgi:hypothetical protein
MKRESSSERVIIRGGVEWRTPHTTSQGYILREGGDLDIREEDTIFS